MLKSIDHFIREQLDNGELCLPYIRSVDQITDVFTKGATKDQLLSVIGKLCVRGIYAQLEEEGRR